MLKYNVAKIKYKSNHNSYWGYTVVCQDKSERWNNGGLCTLKKQNKIYKQNIKRI